MAYLRSLSEHFWKRFRDEYLLELRSHHTQGNDPERLAEVGEIVVIHGTNKRNDWRLGKIISLNAGSDGRIRSGVVRTFDGSKSRYIRRAIERLHPIEVKSVMPVSKDEIAESSNSIDDGIVSSGRSNRPRRVAADIAESSNPNGDGIVSSGRSDRPRRVAAETEILRRRLAEQ